MVDVVSKTSISFKETVTSFCIKCSKSASMKNPHPIASRDSRGLCFRCYYKEEEEKRKKKTGKKGASIKNARQHSGAPVKGNRGTRKGKQESS